MKQKAKIWLLSACMAVWSSEVWGQATPVLEIADAEAWSYYDIPAELIGETVRIEAPFYVCNNYYHQSGRYTIAPHRIFSATNQELPGTPSYRNIVSANQTAGVTLNGISDYHRMGERITSLTVRLDSRNSWTVTGTPVFNGNSRTATEAGLPDIDLRGQHTLTACAFNLEYYLVANLGSGTQGPLSETEQARQQTKIGKAVSRIGADVFGFVEVAQGQEALAQLAETLTKSTGRRYGYIDDGSSASGTWTKSGYVYCTETLEPVGKMRSNNTGVSNRKRMQSFRDKRSGESFIFSINHFKAKSGSGSGKDADQGDGQGTFNYSRTQEAESVLSQYASNRSFYDEEDILIMGDLNAYAKEDPIMTLVNGGMTDLHRYFHKDSSYSYVYHGQAGYLDHALCNSTMLTQVTGMAAWHINSDEDDRFTYNGSLSDLTMFRCSDHDPIIVGLRLGENMAVDVAESYTRCEVGKSGGKPVIRYADGGYFRIFSISGELMTAGSISGSEYSVERELPQGMYIVNVYVEGRVKRTKIMF